MTITTINPATEQILAEYAEFAPRQIEDAIAEVAAAFLTWRERSFAERGAVLRRAATLLRARKERYGDLMTREMGKPIVEAEAEVEKCAWNCDFYAEHAERMLADERVATEARESFVAFEPLGPVLAIMPWNFPFWQVFRFVAPALMAGNTALLKHASNVSGCALAIEEVLRDAGLPPEAFRTLLVSGAATEAVIADRRIRAVTLTGSDSTGAIVAAAAGQALKKTVLELGGSDPFIVLADADVEAAAALAVRARFQNTGQSCIAAKRFIVEQGAVEAFEQAFVATARELKVGDPLDRATRIGPLARGDLREALARQVQTSVAQGARLLLGGAALPGRGYFFAPTVLADVTPAMPVFHEETFGPVAALVRARNAEHAIALANESDFGLGAALWTRDEARARQLARRIEAGAVFVNGMVASDPRLPFGGVKRSGYGRELSSFGIREFVNVQSIWVGPAAVTTAVRQAVTVE